MFTDIKRPIDFNEGKRYQCPSCGSARSFARDRENPEVGFCFRCNYTVTWSKWEEQQTYGYGTQIERAFRRPEPEPPQQYVSEAILNRTIYRQGDAGPELDYDLWERNGFLRFLLDNFDNDDVAEAVETYQIGTAKPKVFDGREIGGTVFWHIDAKGRICKPKIMFYNPDTGRRIKQQGDAPPFHTGGFNNAAGYKYCLFGEHLLSGLKKNQKVWLVESEKTAIICRIKFGGVWLATGGASSGLNKLLVLKRYHVSIWSDMDEAGLEASEKIEKYLTRNGCPKVLVDCDKTPEMAKHRVALRSHKEYLDGYDMADVVLELEQLAQPNPEPAAAPKLQPEEPKPYLTKMADGNWEASPEYWPDVSDAFCREGAPLSLPWSPRCLAAKAVAALRKFACVLIGEPLPDTPEVVTSDEIDWKSAERALNPKKPYAANYELFDKLVKAGLRKAQTFCMRLRDKDYLYASSGKKDQRGPYRRSTKPLTAENLSAIYQSYLTH